ncbi:MAG: pyridoxamine 5'-phosphate oxidase family protein [Sedimentisphaerales bacterium]|nr:pyridoxamine 5'-phosphate oxidase family protein [Sedimentisphaerales bacterium]
MITKGEILEFINKNPLFSLATAQGNQPHVRIIMLYKADKDGIIFCTGRNKDVFEQLQSNPAVELCFYSPNDGRQVRIEGDVEMLDDLELKMQIVEQFTFLKPWIESRGYEILIPFCLKNGKATVWTMETNFDPKQYIQL